MVAQLQLSAGAVTSTITASNAKADAVITNFLKWHHQDADPPVDVDAMTAQEKADMFMAVVVGYVTKKARQFAEEDIRETKEGEIATELAALNVAWEG